MERFHYLDTSKYSNEDDVQNGLGDGIHWVGTDGPTNFLDPAPNYDTFSPSTYVSYTGGTPDDNTYWEAINCASGDFVVTVENFTRVPSGLYLFIRTLATDAEPNYKVQIVSPFYVTYRSGQNEGLANWSPTYDTQYFASGLTTFDFPQTTGNFVNNHIELTIDSGWAGYTNLIISGYPEISFRISPNAACTGLIQVSELGLYSSGSLNITNNSIPLYIGSASSVNSGLSLYIYGYDNLNSGVDLYIAGKDYSSGNIPLYIGAHTDSSGEIPLYIYGYDQSSGNIPLYIGSSTTINSGIDLYIYGHDTSSGVTPLYIYGHDTSSGTLPLVIGAASYHEDSGNFPLYINSTTNSGLFNTLELIVYNEADFDYRNTMVLAVSGGGILGSTSSTLPLYLHSDNSVDSGISLYLRNEWVLSSGVIPLYITTPSGTEDAVPLSGVMNLYMSRQYEGVSYSSPLYISGPIQITSGLSMYIAGEASGLYNNIDMYISGVGVSTGTINLYTRGF